MHRVRLSLCWVTLYVLAAWLSRETALADTGLALFWPAAGVAALWILCSGEGRTLRVDLSLLFVSSTLTNLVTEATLLPALLLAAANIVVALVVREVISRSSIWLAPHGRLPDLASTADVAALGRASVAAGVASAPLGVLAGYLLSGQWSLLGILSWTVRNTTGTFVVTCVVLTLVTAHRVRRAGLPGHRGLAQVPHRHTTWELVLGAGVVAALMGVVFGNSQHLPLAFVMIATCAIVGLRFVPAVAAVQSLALSAVAILATMAGWGPFGVITDPWIAALVVQGFVLTTVVITITLSQSVADRQRLIQQLRSSEAEADERAQLLDVVTQSMAHGLAVVDADGRCLVTNVAAHRLAAGLLEVIESGDVPERHGVTRVDASPVTLDELPHALALRGEPAPETDLLVNDAAQGRMTVLSVRAEPLDLTGQHPRRVAVLTLQDVTEQRAQVLQLESFAGVVAHDLRNPLAAVSGWTAMLAKHLETTSSHDEFSRMTLERIGRSGQSMADLIEDLLAYATAANAPLVRTTVDLDALVASISYELRAGTTTAPIITAHELGTIHADKLLVTQLMANVLGNAVKYVAPGVRPRVRVTTSHTDGNVEIQVSDNGIGIPPDARSQVFEGFARVEEYSAAYAGTGLGLAISARAAERHDGHITAGPGPDGIGTTITISLPVKPTVSV